MHGLLSKWHIQHYPVPRNGWMEKLGLVTCPAGNAQAEQMSCEYWQDKTTGNQEGDF